jgi:nudix-type nucleoside diphosphatase (YffH/AdpP family)
VNTIDPQQPLSKTAFAVAWACLAMLPTRDMPIAAQRASSHHAVMEAKIIESRTIYDRWTNFREAEVRLPNGVTEKRVIEDHGGAVAVLLYDPERLTALLVTQPRAPVLWAGEEPLLEVVAGGLDGKTAEETVRAEAMEEAGVSVSHMRHVATLWPMPAVSTEKIALYLAEYSTADRVGSGGGAADENECIELMELPLIDLWKRLKSGTLTDGKTFTLLQALMLDSPHLFRG